jgi:hypothetical protein
MNNKNDKSISDLSGLVNQSSVEDTPSGHASGVSGGTSSTHNVTQKSASPEPESSSGSIAPSAQNESVDALRSRLHDLETYIDGRKTHWETQATNHLGTRTQLSEAQRLIGVQDERISAYARKTALLQNLIAAQKQSLTAARRRLNDSFRSGTIGASQPAPSTLEVNAKLRAIQQKLVTMRNEQQRLKTELRDKNAHIDALSGKIAKIGIERTEAISALQLQRRAIDKIEGEIRARLAKTVMRSRQPQQIAALSASIHRLDARCAHLRSKAEQNTDKTTGRLTLLEPDENHPAEFTIGRLPLLIGRGALSDIQILRDSISRKHARLIIEQDGIAIEDLESKNGVRVNNQRVSRQRLNDGDIIAVGHIQLRFTDRINDAASQQAT